MTEILSGKTFKGPGNLRGASKGKISLPSMAAERMRRIKAANETRGKGEHFGKHTGHTQVIAPFNTQAANAPRVDMGRTDFYSSMGGNPAKPNHRPFSRKQGVFPFSHFDARQMMSGDGSLKLAKQHKS